LTYGRVSSIQLDPIEKKPLHYFHPGSMILSIGAIGCNLSCFFCQNWQIAHPKDSTHERPPEVVEIMTEPLGVSELVDKAADFEPSGNIGVAFTYNEPFIWFEYVFDAARALRAAGLKVVLVTNGYVSEAPLRELLPYVDAMNIDIKAFSDEFYKRIGGRRKVVMRTAELAKDACHIELTNLLIPGLNTASSEINALVDWVADSLGPATPLHFSRYFPARRSSIEATAIADMENAYQIASKRLQNVVLGNI
jgi:pyruvate formate lyase activating enzyme